MTYEYIIVDKIKIYIYLNFHVITIALRVVCRRFLMLIAQGHIVACTEQNGCLWIYDFLVFVFFYLYNIITYCPRQNRIFVFRTDKIRYPLVLGEKKGVRCS